MADRGRVGFDRASVRQNALTVQRERRHHERKLRDMKSTLDCGQSKPPEFHHLTLRLKQRQLARERAAQVNRANKLLVNQVAKIKAHHEFTITPAPAGADLTGGGSGSDATRTRTRKSKSLNAPSRLRALQKVRSENQRLLLRLQAPVGVYCSKQWEKERRANEMHLRRLRGDVATLNPRSAATGRESSVASPPGNSTTTKLSKREQMKVVEAVVAKQRTAEFAKKDAARKHALGPREHGRMYATAYAAVLGNVWQNTTSAESSISSSGLPASASAFASETAMATRLV